MLKNQYLLMNTSLTYLYHPMDWAKRIATMQGQSQIERFTGGLPNELSEENYLPRKLGVGAQQQNRKKERERERGREKREIEEENKQLFLEQLELFVRQLSDGLFSVLRKVLFG